MDNSIKKRIKNQKDYIVRLLKQQGKYSPEMSLQAMLTAYLYVRMERLAEEVLDDGHDSVIVELSREGNERRSVNPADKTFLECADKLQRALKALGMNIDAKERNNDTDGFNELFNALKPQDD